MVDDGGSDGGEVHLTMSSGGGTMGSDEVPLAFELFSRGNAVVTSAPGLDIRLPAVQ